MLLPYMIRLGLAGLFSARFRAVTPHTYDAKIRFPVLAAKRQGPFMIDVPILARRDLASAFPALAATAVPNPQLNPAWNHLIVVARNPFRNGSHGLNPDIAKA